MVADMAKAQINRRKKPRDIRVAKTEEILAWLLEQGFVVKQGDKYGMTLAGLRFTASKPPGEVEKYIPGALPRA